MSRTIYRLIHVLPGILTLFLPASLPASPFPVPADRIKAEVIDGYRVFFTIPPTWDLSTYDPGTTVYQATQSITFEPGYATPVGATLLAEILPNGFGVPQATNLTGTADANINWIQSTGYDETGAVIVDSKQFFDDRGRTTQLQDKTFYRAGPATVLTHVLASQTIRDAYGRDAAMTLAAPIDYADFSYRSNFLQHNSLGAVYNHQNFDLSASADKTGSPDPIWDPSSGVPAQGTLGWYYSTSNYWEPYTPTTNYPYTRQTWYSDGTGSAKKKGGEGEVFAMGSGHESGDFVTPVANELDFYLQMRNQLFTTSDLGALPTSLASQSMQLVAHDANGREIVTIQDKGGLTLMTARPGGSDVTVNNSITIPAGGFQYIKLFGNTSVTFGGQGTVYQMDSYVEGPVSYIPGGSFNGSMPYMFPAGYYKVVNTSQTNPATVSYSNGFTDVIYRYYNQLGLMVAMVGAEGVKKLYASPGSYTNKASVPFITLWNYDLQGRLVSRQDQDAGLCQYVCRKDGKIRFSQSAAQAAGGTNSFSFTNYDALGRPVASGQYTPGTGGMTFSTTGGMSGILETTGIWGGLTNGTMTDVSITQYDVADNGHGLSGYTQDVFNLSGAISLTQRYSTIAGNSPSSANLVSATWYNYDEDGRKVWTIQYVNGLGYKTTDYTYNTLGQMVKRVFQKNTSSETFVHYYDYDPANRQLWHVYTNTVDNTGTRQLQATYYYYLHGGVKRVELATGLQGIDYTYTLQGALKAINNSNKTQDPGGDGISNSFPADAFGMVLDYFPGDYSNGRSGIATIKGVNTSGIVAQESYAGTIKAMSWYSEKPVSTGLTDAPTAYIYQYDPKDQFTESTWGTGLNFGTTPTTFTATSYNKEKLGNSSGTIGPYDENGNILYLQRTDASGNLTDQFTYSYTPNTNRLSSISTIVNGTPQTFANYSYDNDGQMTAEAMADGSLPKYMVYDVTGRVSGVYQDGQHNIQTAGFVYDENGRRIKKLSFNTSGQLTQVTYYVGDVVYTQPVTGGTSYGAITAQEYSIDGANGRIGIYYPQGPIYAYELHDHLGNVRAVIAQNGATWQVRMYTDYYPFGKVISSGGTNDYRYSYQGQNAELDGETAWNAFEARMYDSRIGRWLTVDPAGQFFNPYAGMGNNPVFAQDKNGQWLHILIGAIIGAGVQVYKIATSKEHVGFWEGAAKIGYGALSGAVTAAAPGIGGAMLAGGLGNVGEQAIDIAFDPHKTFKKDFSVRDVVVSTAAAGLGKWAGGPLEEKIMNKLRVAGRARFSFIQPPGTFNYIEKAAAPWWYTERGAVSAVLADAATDIVNKNYVEDRMKATWDWFAKFGIQYDVLDPVYIIGHKGPSGVRYDDPIWGSEHD